MTKTKTLPQSAQRTQREDEKIKRVKGSEAQRDKGICDLERLEKNTGVRSQESGVGKIKS